MNGPYAIVGYGVVGRAMHALMKDAVLYDTADGIPSDRHAVNSCEAPFVCVPTPSGADGSADVSCVEEVVSWLRTPLIVLRSTVPPGTTRRLAAEYGKRIVFQPEYLGETHCHPYADLSARTFVVLGGERQDTEMLADIYSQFYHSSVRFCFTDATTAELAKYMENCYFAVKVLFCHEFRRLATTFSVSYNELRELWLADSRMSRSPAPRSRLLHRPSRRRRPRAA